MEFDAERTALTMDIDECDLYRPEGFITVALSHNEDIGRLCAIRKLDQKFVYILQLICILIV